MKVIILVGKPGSGKSSFCAKYPKYVRINQDELGNRQACVEAFRQAMNEKKSVIVDRCNVSKMQRLIWLREAKHYGVTDISAVYLDVHPETCIKRIMERKEHPTIKDVTLNKAQEIVYSFNKTFEMPELQEGFQKILIMKND